MIAPGFPKAPLRRPIRVRIQHIIHIGKRWATTLGELHDRARSECRNLPLGTIRSQWRGIMSSLAHAFDLFVFGQKYPIIKQWRS